MQEEEEGYIPYEAVSERPIKQQSVMDCLLRRVHDIEPDYRENPVAPSFMIVALAERKSSTISRSSGHRIVAGTQPVILSRRAFVHRKTQR